MTSTYKQLCIFLAIALLVGLTGCSSRPEPVYRDTSCLMRVSLMNISSDPFRAVASITPRLRDQILQKRQQNADTMGWLIVPGTNINTVIVQNPPDRANSYYLKHNFSRQPDRDGAFCVDRRCTFGSGTRSELSSITTIYGHSWDDNWNGELFSQIKRYRDTDFARNHPYIYFSTSGEDMAWEVFAVFDTTVHVPYVWPELPNEIYYQVLDVAYQSSLYNYGINITTNDKILTLSTCTYTVGETALPQNAENDYRFVVMARLISPNEQIKAQASFTVNANPLSPDDLPVILMPWQDEI